MPRPPPHGPLERPRANHPIPSTHPHQATESLTESVTPVPQHRVVAMVVALETAFLQVLEHCLNCCYNLAVRENLRLKAFLVHEPEPMSSLKMWFIHKKSIIPRV